jgi:hypothetical protein
MQVMAKQPGVEPDVLHPRAQRAMLTGLVGGDDVYDVMEAVAPNHVPGRPTPDVSAGTGGHTLELAFPPGAEPCSTRACASATCLR